MSKKPVSIHITHDDDHQMEIRCSGDPFDILYCLAKAAAETIRDIDCIDDKVAGVSAFSLQMLEFLTEEDEDNEQFHDRGQGTPH